MTSSRKNAVGPALIVALFFVFFMFLVVSRKGNAGTSHPQSVSQNR
jgi:hypothetical protein